MTGLSGNELTAITLIVLLVFILGRLPELGVSLQRVARLTQATRTRTAPANEVTPPGRTEVDEVCVITPIDGDGE